MLEVEKILKKSNLNYRILKLKGKAISAEDVIENSIDKVNEDEIFKTIIVVDKDKKKYALLVNRHRMVDFGKVKKLVGSKVRLANEEELKEEGFEPGNVCPVLVRIPLFVDEEFLKFKKFNCGSGDLKHGLEINTKDLEKVKKYESVALKK